MSNKKKAKGVIRKTEEGKMKVILYAKQADLKPFLPLYPFKTPLQTATSHFISSDRSITPRRIPLTESELDVIRRAVGSEKISHIKSFLTQKCNVQDPTPLSWKDIIGHLELWLSKNITPSNLEKPAETGQDATSNKKNSKLDFFYKLYEKTLKALFSAVIEAMKS